MQRYVSAWLKKAKILTEINVSKIVWKKSKIVWKKSKIVWKKSKSL